MSAPRVGLYLRLSREDEDGTEESQSITNQRTFLERYVSQMGWETAAAYIDDGWSGTTFERPAFQQMLRDVEAGKLDAIVTKDLSRLGRDYIQTGYYLQRYFPERGVRYIAVSDGYDSASGGGLNAAMPFLSVVNDMYAADISKKVRTALTTLKQEGKFIGSSAPLGYQKDQSGGLVVDPQAASVVREIFRHYLSRGSVAGTAKYLTESGVPTPSAYKGASCTQERFSGVWSDTMVRRILTNPTYAGHLTQNRTRKVNYKVDKKVHLPREEWITVPNTHEPLVSQADFDRTQELLAARSYRSPRGKGHLMTGLAFCADCGSPMTYVRESPARTYMVCQGYRKGGRLGLCTPHRVREDAVLAAVRRQLRELAQGLDEEALCHSLERERADQPRSRQMDAVCRRLADCKQVAASLYRDKATGVLRESEFKELFEQNRDERARLEQYLTDCEWALAREQEQLDLGERVRQVLSFQPLERNALVSLVERLLIHQDKTVEIYFRFSKPQ